MEYVYRLEVELEAEGVWEDPVVWDAQSGEAKSTGGQIGGVSPCVRLSCVPPGSGSSWGQTGPAVAEGGSRVVWGGFPP